MSHFHIRNTPQHTKPRQRRRKIILRWGERESLTYEPPPTHTHILALPRKHKTSNKKRSEMHYKQQRAERRDYIDTPPALPLHPLSYLTNVSPPPSTSTTSTHQPHYTAPSSLSAPSTPLPHTYRRWMKERAKGGSPIIQRRKKNQIRIVFVDCGR